MIDDGHDNEAGRTRSDDERKWYNDKPDPIEMSIEAGNRAYQMDEYMSEFEE